MGESEEKKLLTLQPLPAYSEVPPVPQWQGTPQGPPPHYFTSSRFEISQSPLISQPTAARERRYKHGDHFFILSLVMTFFCFIFCMWWGLICTIPAIVFAINAQEAEVSGNDEAKMRYRDSALYLNITAIGVSIVVVLAIALFITLYYTVFVIEQ